MTGLTLTLCSLYIQANREYRSMVANVDSGQDYGRENLIRAGEFSRELRGMNKQLTVIFNTLLTVAGAFFFGFKGVEMIMPGAVEMPIRLMFGLTLGTLVFFADLYFLVKDMHKDEPTACK